MLRRDAGAGVTDVDLDAVAVGRADVQRAALPAMASLAFRNRFRNTCCSLPELPWISGKSGVQIRLHLHLRSLELVLQQRQRVRDDLVQVDVAEFRGAGAREVQQVVDDLRSAERLPRDLFQQRAQLGDRH